MARQEKSQHNPNLGGVGGGTVFVDIGGKVGELCSDLPIGATSESPQFHRFLEKISLSNALIEMYAKSGNINQARQVFDKMLQRDVISWSTMIVGLANHACAHSGFLEIGLKYFNSMKTDYNLNPGIQHYGCLVDLLGRTSCITRAFELVKTMPMKPDSAIWGSLLSSCRTKGNLEMAVIAVEHLLELEPEDVGNYVMLSNIYADLGRWDCVSKVRKLMREIKPFLAGKENTRAVKKNKLPLFYIKENKTPMLRMGPPGYDGVSLIILYPSRAIPIRLMPSRVSRNEGTIPSSGEFVPVSSSLDCYTLLPPFFEIALAVQHSDSFRLWVLLVDSKDQTTTEFFQPSFCSISSDEQFLPPANSPPAADSFLPGDCCKPVELPTGSLLAAIFLHTGSYHRQPLIPISAPASPLLASFLSAVDLPRPQQGCNKISGSFFLGFLLADDHQPFHLWCYRNLSAVSGDCHCHRPPWPWWRWAVGLQDQVATI
ncbi:hypothetical protein LXL04_008643 [Taraxacum kok-saghyz]